MDQWFYNDDGEQRGPVAKEEINSLLAARKINTSTLVWSEGMPDWRPVGSLSGFEVSPYVPPTVDPGWEADVSGYLPNGPQVRPWVRYWARTFDFLLFCLVGGFLIGMFLPDLLKIHNTLLGVLILVVYNFIEPISLSAFGTTPFKALMRVRVRNQDGSKLSYSAALKRTFSLWVKGMGLGIPIVALITSAASHGRLSRDGITPWDQSGGFIVSHQKVTWWRWLVLVATFVLFIALLAYGKEV